MVKIRSVAARRSALENLPEEYSPVPGQVTGAPDLHAPFLPGIDELDHMLHALQARAVDGISPAAVMNARLDWLVHIANSPSKQSALMQKAFRRLGAIPDLCRQVIFRQRFTLYQC